MERERRKEREAPDPLWALAVTNALMAELPKLASPPEARESSAPNAISESQAPATHGPELDEPGDATGAQHGKAAGGARGSPDLPSTLSAEVSDERLGRLQLHIERVDGRLDIVINVADARVKALIEAEHAQLVKTLKDAGLQVASLQIGAPSRAGTALAQERGGAEKARAGASFRQPAARWRTYTASSAEEDDADGEGVDLTA
ncbi:MAG TPA: flagellar hook-length control protein FliK [Polyangiaceae bacterium]|nr:flagellar hook-length control protein FliK [Polyangiaceae bacterium]